MIKKNPKIMDRVNMFLLSYEKSKIPLERERGRFLHYLSERFQIDASSFYRSYQASDFCKWYENRLDQLWKKVPKEGTSSNFDCESLYLLVRACKPKIVVETGVLYGASSAHILEAMRQNGVGELYSLGYANPHDSPPNNFLIPEGLRNKWHLVNGNIIEELPKLLLRLSQIDFFFHDSDHSFKHMMWEYETVWGKLGPKGVLTSHDVLTLKWQKNAFHSFCRRHGLKSEIFRNLGIASGGSRH